MIQTSILHGDSLVELRQLEAGSVQLVFTSPPYGIGKAYEKRQTVEDYVAGMRPIVLECARLVAPGGFIAWQVGYHVRNRRVTPIDALFYPLFAAAGLKLCRRIVWTFGHGLHCTHRFSGRHEMLMIFTRDPMAPDVVSRLEALDEHGDVWKVTNVKANHPERIGGHPCQFPLELPRRAIAALTAPGELVVDPFAGTGTTNVAARALGRNSIGVELDASYVAMAAARLAADSGPLFA